MPSAYCLVAHGSRDPRPQQSLEALKTLVEPAFPPGTTVLIANLEAQTLPLHQQILGFIPVLWAQGIDRLVVLPLFLGAGVHVTEDLPQEMALVRELSGQGMDLALLPHLGRSPLLKSCIEKAFQGLAAAVEGEPIHHRLLLAHGSRRWLGNRDILTLGQSVGADVAFWRADPSLETVLAGYGESQTVMIMPYFLFAGGLTDFLAGQLPQWRAAYPHLRLYWGEPLGPSPALASLIVQLLQSEANLSPVPLPLS